MPDDDGRSPPEELGLVSHEEAHRWRALVDRLVGDGVDADAARRAADEAIRALRRRVALDPPSTPPPPPSSTRDDEEPLG